MKSALLVFSFLFVALNAAVVNRNLPQILDTPTDTPPCSTNASSAYVDIILVIDTSANMGTSNLRKVCLYSLFHEKIEKVASHSAVNKRNHT
uniref:VWFA domain-containing protein n=1 Tax=Acrobeloides nanus TaxID=290746 RepID=A0A914CQR7_9BILA